MALIPRKHMEKFEEESNQSTENTSGTKKNEEAEDETLMDGREKEWQDRGRVQLDKPDPDVKTNIERDFEPLDDGRTEKQKPVDPEY